MSGGGNPEWAENTQDFMGTIGQKLRARRKQLGKSIIGLAAEVGLTKSTVSRIERGESDFPVSHLFNFSTALDVRLSEIIPEPFDMAYANSQGTEPVTDEKAAPVQSPKPP